MSFDAVAEFALTAGDPPEPALDMAATLIIDTLGVAAGAAGMEAGRLARDHAHRFHGAAEARDAATILFDGRRAAIPGVVFAAATQIDNLDAHDGLNATKGHIGCAVVPALCAFAEALPDLGGREALAAMVLAYEVAARAGIALHATAADYHTSGAWNGLGVAALGCRLGGDGAEVLRHALGIAEYHGPRGQMMREIATPTMLHDGSGMGALVGSMAVLLAREGFTGAPAVTVEGAEAAPHWADLGSRWTILDSYIKPYPVCRWGHGALDAVARLMARHAPAPEAIARVEVRTFAQAAALFPGLPSTTSEAQYSLAFALAALIVRGRVGTAEIGPEGLTDPAVAALLPRIAVTEDARHSARFPAGRWSDVTLVLADGRRLESGDVDARGGPEAPLPLAEIEAKFHDLAALPEARAAAICAMRERLREPETRFADLLALIHPAPEAPHA